MRDELKPFRKSLTVLLIVLISALLAGVYGIIHDQFSYTFSSEYYTKFKFYQFRILREGELNPGIPVRKLVAQVGWLATWWFGLLLGLVIGLVTLIFPNPRMMLRFAFRALLLNLLVALETGIIGLIYGHYFLADKELNWYFPDNLVHKADFIAVGSMHNFSYLGGILGLVVAVIYLVRQKKKLAKVTHILNQ